jgi:molybdopterin-containing oxidoreductase family membrane subunit
MWYERFNIVVTSLSKDYLPSSWTSYSPTWVEIGIYFGTIGIFTIGVLFFFRFVPMIAISEVKSVLKPTEITEKH